MSESSNILSTVWRRCGSTVLFSLAFVAGCVRDISRIEQPLCVVGSATNIAILVPHAGTGVFFFRNYTEDQWRDLVIRAENGDTDCMWMLYEEYKASFYKGDHRLHDYEYLLLDAAIGGDGDARLEIYGRLVKGGETSAEWRRWRKKLRPLGHSYQEVIIALNHGIDPKGIGMANDDPKAREKRWKGCTHY